MVAKLTKGVLGGAPAYGGMHARMCDVAADYLRAR